MFRWFTTGLPCRGAGLVGNGEPNLERQLRGEVVLSISPDIMQCDRERKEQGGLKMKGLKMKSPEVIRAFSSHLVEPAGIEPASESLLRSVLRV